MSTHDIEQFIYDIARALLVPVLILALLIAAITLVELGRMGAELWHRRHRSLPALDKAIAKIRASVTEGDVDAALTAGLSVSSSRAMARTLRQIVPLLLEPHSERVDERAAKLLADFDYGSVRRLERTRILVRLGPAVGLMGTLIPLSPALSALAKGSVTELADNLRIAFSVTVLGLLVGALAFAMSLVRDRLYSQDLSDLEYMWAALSPPDTPTGSEPEEAIMSDLNRVNP